MPEPWTSLRLAKRATVSHRNVVVGWPRLGPDAIYVSLPDEMVKLDRKTLRVLWKRDAGRSWTAYLADRRILVIMDVTSRQVGALRPETGEWIWTKETRHGALVWEGRLVLPGEELRIVEPTTGEVVETFPMAGVAGPGTLCGDILLCEDEERGEPLKSIHLKERRLLWERNLLSDMRSQYGVEQEVPVISLVAGTMRDRFIATQGGSTFACSLEDGRILWRTAVPVPYKWPNVHEGRIYDLFYDRFIALDEATGEVVYDVPDERLRGAYSAKPGTIYRDKLAIPNESGHLAVFNLEDGSLAWLYEYKGQLWSTGEADGRLLAGTGDGELLVFADKSSA